ncbi:MAG: serine/threonine protein kinase [Fuerstiella sp.]|nr:serine/threonine protein kinase [Fuerstiella sp.]MCP4856590.1 serine/threonine protein kinase [Fuerstiella sp.]
MPDHADHAELVLDGLRTVTSDVNRDRDTLEVIASQFLEDHRRLLNPSIEDYACFHRDQADSIRKVFPVLLDLERNTDAAAARVRDEQFPHSLPIRKLAQYQLETETHRTAKTIVYRARDMNTTDTVSVTVLPWKADDVPRLHLQLARETAIARRLKHPGIVPVLDVGCDGGYFFYVTPLISGIDGAALMERFSGGAQRWGRIVRGDWETFARIGSQLAGALHYAHQMGTLHNDIRPDSIFFSRSANACLQNFRLEQCAQTTSRAGCDENDAEAAPYMPPESFEGCRDERSDVYSLGTTLLMLATQSSTADTKPSHQTGSSTWSTPRRFLRWRVGGMPRCLANVLQKATAADPDKRFQSAARFASALKHVDTTLTERARKSVGVREHVRIWTSRLL